MSANIESSSDKEQNGPDAGWFHAQSSGTPLRAPGPPSATYAYQLAQLEERRRAEIETGRAKFWFAVKVVAVCWAGSLAGLVPMAWALHTTNMSAARAAWQVGQVIGPLCVVVTLLVAWHRWQRADW